LTEKTKIFSCHTADFKPVKQAVNGTAEFKPVKQEDNGTADFKPVKQAVNGTAILTSLIFPGFFINKILNNFKLT